MFKAFKVKNCELTNHQLHFLLTLLPTSRYTLLCQPPPVEAGETGVRTGQGGQRMCEIIRDKLAFSQSACWNLSSRERELRGGHANNCDFITHKTNPLQKEFVASRLPSNHSVI